VLPGVMPVAVPELVPVTTTAWPTKRLGVAVQEHWPLVPVTMTPDKVRPLESDSTSMIRAAALSVALPLMGHDSVESASSVMARKETSVGWMT